MTFSLVRTDLASGAWEKAGWLPESFETADRGSRIVSGAETPGTRE